MAAHCTFGELLQGALGSMSRFEGLLRLFGGAPVVVGGGHWSHVAAGFGTNGKRRHGEQWKQSGAGMVRLRRDGDNFRCGPYR